MNSYYFSDKYRASLIFVSYLMSNQQRLFEHYNPIEERVGKSFFEELPTDSGVYKMYGRDGQLLYVGKAKNLRNRLFTYRRAKMGTTPRKTVRLIRMTHDIEIIICDSEKEALLLENKLIREHQPEFNHAKKQPETYYYISLECAADALEFSLQMHIPEKEFVFGAFKGHRLVRKTMGGLIRVLYIFEHDIDSAFALPSILTRKLTPMQYQLPIEDSNTVVQRFWPHILDYFMGNNLDLLDAIVEECQSRKLLESFAGSMIMEDLESLKWFYERCSHRNYQIRQQLNLDDALIPQQKLDDYLIEWVFAKEESGSVSE